MKTRLHHLLPLLLAFATPAWSAETYRIDPAHSSVSFKIKHLFAKVTGQFSEFSGTISGDANKPDEIAVQVEIRTASINTREPKRDEHLRSAEFFDVEQHPTITFASRKVNRTGEDSAFVTGDLTMRGVTREAILQVKFLGRGPDQQGIVRTGWEAQTALKRSDYGLLWSKAVEGTQVVSDDVEIELNIEAVAVPAAPSIEITAVPAIPGTPVASLTPLPAVPPLPGAEAPMPPPAAALVPTAPAVPADPAVIAPPPASVPPSPPLAVPPTGTPFTPTPAVPPPAESAPVPLPSPAPVPTAPEVAPPAAPTPAL